jgi:hypothetical protein
MTEPTQERRHHYHAEASVIEGHLQLPFVQEIAPQAHTLLAPDGAYVSSRVENFRVEEGISIRSGYTHLVGNPSDKPNEGATTLMTVVVEGLNVFEVLTADRVVGQIITVHPIKGNVPRISFLGTRFENLRIAGHPVKLHLDLGIVGPKPENDAPYGLEAAFKDRISSQYKRILEHKDLPSKLSEHYHRLSSSLGSPEAVECSLVHQAAGDYPGSSFGHKIHVPDFGWIALGKVRIAYKEEEDDRGLERSTTVHLTMIDLKLGCPAAGSVPVGSGSSNGGAT